MKAVAERVQLRPMREEDVDQVMEIAASLKEAPHWMRAAYLSALDLATTTRRIALVAEDELRQAPGSGSLLAQESAQLEPCPCKTENGLDEPSNGGVVGFLIARVVAQQAELESIAVWGAEQRRGVGRKLIFAMIEDLKGAGVREVLLEVRASNERALEFYRSLGWRESGRRARYYADPEEDAVLMNLTL